MLLTTKMTISTQGSNPSNSPAVDPIRNLFRWFDVRRKAFYPASEQFKESWSYPRTFSNVCSTDQQPCAIRWVITSAWVDSAGLRIVPRKACLHSIQTIVLAASFCLSWLPAAFLFLSALRSRFWAAFAPLPPPIFTNASSDRKFRPLDFSNTRKTCGSLCGAASRRNFF